MKLRSVNLYLLTRRVWFVVLATVFCPSLIAQIGTANITGMVEDSTGARVMGAKVELINTETGTENNSISNRYGIFLLSGVLPGAYVLQITKNGFATSQFTGIALNAGDSKQFLIHMKVGPVSETVTVRASNIEVSRSDGSVSTEIDGRFAASLPLIGDSLQGLIAATPGITPLNPQSAASAMATQGSFSVNGQATDANYYSVDGVTANINAGFPTGLPQTASAGTIGAETALGTTQGLTPLNDLQEFRVLSATYSAKYGRAPGGQFLFTTKSGTNVFHGSGFEYFRNRAFNATDWFDRHYGLRKPPQHQNEFGGAFSGPLIPPGVYDGRNRKFFFADYEGYRVQQPFAARMQYVPSLALRDESTGLQSLLNAFPKPTGPEIVDSAGSPSGLAPFINTYSLPGDANSVSARIDQNFSSRLHIFFRYNETPSEAEYRQLASLTHNTANSRTFTLGIDTQLSNRIRNQFRIGYARDKTQRFTVPTSYAGSTAINLAVALGDRNANPYLGGYTDSLVSSRDEAYIRFPGVGDTSLITSHADDDLIQWNWTDNFSLERDRHLFNFGVDARRLYSPIGTDGSTFDASFYNRDAVTSNLASNVSLLYDSFQQLTLHQWSSYAQDEWRAMSSLTFSLGLRWKLNDPPSFQNLTTASALVGKLSSPATLQVVNLTYPLWHIDWRNFAPRVGVAWSLHEKRARPTILRAGAGVFYGSANKVAIDASNDGIDASIAAELQDVPLPISKDEYNFLAGPERVSYKDGTAYWISPHLQLPYTLQYTISLEQALGDNQTLTASYVDAAGRRLLHKQSFNANPDNLNLGYVAYYPNHLTSSYNALQLKYQRMLSHGLQALLSYTWSHTIDYGSTSPLYALTRASSDQDVRNNFQAAFTWDMGRIAPRRGFDNLLNRWSLDGRISARSGFPITLYGNMHLRDYSGDRYYSGVDLLPGRPLYLYGPQYPGGRILNGGPDASNPAFVLPGEDSAGNAPRNLVRGCGEFQVNLALHRSFPIRKRLHGEFRISAFNVFNHPNFGYIDPYLEDRQFGQTTRMLDSANNSISPVYQQGGPRTLQVSLNLSF